MAQNTSEDFVRFRTFVIKLCLAAVNDRRRANTIPDVIDRLAAVGADTHHNLATLAAIESIGVERMADLQKLDEVMIEVLYERRNTFLLKQ